MSSIPTMNIKGSGSFEEGVAHRGRPRWHMPTVLWLCFATLVGLAGMILGAWATHKADKTQQQLFDYAGVSLGSSPQPVNSAMVYAGSIFDGSGFWDKAPDMLFARSDHGVYPRGDSVFIFGGITNVSMNGTGVAMVLNQTVMYNTYSGKSTRMADMPEPRCRFGYGVLGDNLYVIGGFNALEDNGASPVASVMRYNFVSNVWDMLPSSSNMNTIRSDLCSAGVQGKVYAVGGWNGSYDAPLGTAEEFDPATGKWTMISNTLVVRGDCKAVNLTDKLFVMGGVTHVNLPGKDCINADWLYCNPFTNTTEMYDPMTKVWTRKADMLMARGDFAAEQLTFDRVFVAGGENGIPGVKNEVAVRQTEMYISEHDIWVPKAPLAVPRFRFDIAHIRELVYSFGGHPTCDSYSTDPDELCYNVALNSVYGFFDIKHPNIYAFVRSNN